MLLSSSSPWKTSLGGSRFTVTGEGVFFSEEGGVEDCDVVCGVSFLLINRKWQSDRKDNRKKICYGVNGVGVWWEMSVAEKSVRRKGREGEK